MCANRRATLSYVNSSNSRSITRQTVSGTHAYAGLLHACLKINSYITRIHVFCIFKKNFFFPFSPTALRGNPGASQRRRQGNTRKLIFTQALKMTRGKFVTEINVLAYGCTEKGEGERKPKDMKYLRELTILTSRQKVLSGSR